MSREVADEVLQYLRHTRVPTLDITGGAPELNAQFRYLVTQARALGVHVMDRCNLTITEQPGQEDLVAFLAAHEVEVVASLPCYLEDNVDRQRGDGVFHASLRALRKLNAAGYAQPGSARGVKRAARNSCGVGVAGVTRATGFRTRDGLLDHPQALDRQIVDLDSAETHLVRVSAQDTQAADCERSDGKGADGKSAERKRFGTYYTPPQFTGKLSFFVDGAPAGTTDVTTSGQAHFRPAGLSVGHHTLQVAYTGTECYLDAQKTIEFEITPTPVTVTLAGLRPPH